MRLTPWRLCSSCGRSSTRTCLALFQATPPKSARALAQSKTLRELVARWRGRQLLDCASPLALSHGGCTALNAYFDAAAPTQRRAWAVSGRARFSGFRRIGRAFGGCAQPFVPGGRDGHLGFWQGGHHQVHGWLHGPDITIPDPSVLMATI